MPTYVYKFVKTGETIEVAQAFTDPALTEAKHPRTGRRMAVKKVFTPVGVTFKGTGFYKTDSRGSSSSTKPARDGESTAGAPEHKADTATPEKQRRAHAGAHAEVGCGAVVESGGEVVHLTRRGR